MFFHFIHAQLIYIISHETQGIFPCKFLKQQLGKLRCHYWGNCWYFLASHETFRIFLILLLIMTPLADLDLIYIGCIIGRMIHEWGVSLKGKDSHIFCIACSKGNMRKTMATTAKYLFPFEVDHKFDDHSLYNHGQVIKYDLYFQLTHSTIYFLLVNVRIFTNSHLATYYLPCHFLKKKWMRLHCVLLRRCLYHTAEFKA